MKKSILPLLLISTLGLSNASAQDEVSALDVIIAAYDDPDTEGNIDKMLELMPRDDDYYILEGDLLLTKRDVEIYLSSMKNIEPIPGTELLVGTSGGADVYWQNSEERKLRYVINESSFPSQQLFENLRENLSKAAGNWEDSCPECDIDFLELENIQNPVIGDNVDFIVRYRDQKGSTIASAFFPNWGDDRKYINIYPKYFQTNFDRVGVLRHELGHVLGYRHEHIQGIRGCRVENNEWRRLTEYDPKSVMHYLCGDGGNRLLEITASDIIGHRKLYGQ